MSRIRYFIRFFFAFIGRFKGIILLFTVVGLISFVIIRSIISIFFSGTTQRIGITGRYQINELPLPILEMVSEGLTKITSDKTVEPDIASSWETPDKGKTWIFHIKKGVIWHDGSAVTSKNISYKFSDLTLETPDSSTIIFHLPYPFTPFPVAVSRPTFKRGLIGVGEWRVSNLSVKGNYIESLELQKKKDKIIYKFYPSEDMTKTAFKLGLVDEIRDVLDPEPFTTWKNTKVTSNTNLNQIVTLFFNTQDKDLSEKSIRQALAYAINKNFPEESAISPISPDSWAYNPQVKQYSYDPDKANKLISDLPDEVRSKLKIRLITSPVLLDTAEKIYSDWQKVNLANNLQVSSIIPQDFQAFLTILEVPDDPDQYSLWHSTQDQTNLSNYSSPRIDKLLEDGRIELDIEARKKIYLDFQRFLMEDLPALFLYHPTYYTISRR